MTRVLITGAGGFVGSHLALGLSRLGFEVVVSDQHFDSEALGRLGGLERLTCDVRELSRHLGAVGYAGDYNGDYSVDYVVHAAAVTADPDDLGVSASEYLETAAQVTTAALELARMGRAKRFIFVSSAGVFSGAQTPPLDETAQPDATGPYAAAKRTGERAAHAHRTSGDLDAVSVRLGNLYGLHERPRATRPRVGLLARMVREAEAGRITVLHPDALREWSLVDDLAPAFARLLTHEAPPDVAHLCAPSVVTGSALAQMLQRSLPGTQLERSSDPLALPVRPPLTSIFTEALGLTHWTPLEEGLTRLLRARCAA